MNPTEGKLTEAPLTKIEIMKRLRKCKADLESHTFQDKKINGRTCGKNIFGEKNEALFCDECKENMFQLSLTRMALESLKAPAVTTGEWRSIDDAPKDGSWIFVIIDGEIAVAHWSEHASFDNLNLTPDGDSTPIAGWETDGEGFMVYPTFWASPHPLPQPPNSTTLSAPAPLSAVTTGERPKLGILKGVKYPSHDAMMLSVHVELLEAYCDKLLSAPAPLSSEAVGKVREALLLGIANWEYTKPQSMRDQEDFNRYQQKYKCNAEALILMQNALALLTPSPSEAEQ